jgi:uncharacterized protein (DUF58 family)
MMSSTLLFQKRQRRFVRSKARGKGETKVIRHERKPLRDYFLKREQQLIARTDISVFDSRRYLSHPGVAAFLLLAGLFAFSFSSRVCFLLFLTELVFLAILFGHIHFVAKKVSLKRVLPSKTLRELDMAEVIVEIQNRSDFYISGLIVDDIFGLTKEPLVKLAPDRLRGRSMLRLSYKRICDAGMGKHEIGPITARLTDALGIFEVRILEDTIHEVEVYPRIDRIPEVAVLPSSQNAKYGNYEVASRGLSVNFSGVRPFERGDSLRHIAWRLSMRGQGLLVKEFEKVVNCDVNIVLNISPQWQIGRGATSTWEAAKDASLSIIQQQLDLGNSVAFFSEHSLIEPGAGGDHFHYLAKHVASLKPTYPDSKRGESLPIDPKPLLGKYRDFYARGSNIFYITPFNLAEYKRSEPWLRRLRAEGFQVTCILIDTNSYWVQFLESVSTGLLIGAKLMQGIDEEAAKLERLGIVTYVVKDKESLRQTFQRKGQFKVAGV